MASIKLLGLDGVFFCWFIGSQPQHNEFLFDCLVHGSYYFVVSVSLHIYHYKYPIFIRLLLDYVLPLHTKIIADY